MTINERELEHIADLANLDLTDKEKNELTVQLRKIINYVEKINSLNLKNVNPSGNVFNLSNVFREDVIGKSLEPEVVLELTPDHDINLIKVPKFL